MNTLKVDVRGLPDGKIRELERRIEQWKRETKLPKLSPAGQQLLASAKKKIKAINDDLLNAVGLTREEADIAAKVGLIDPDQKYWWLEDWQKGEREAEREIQERRGSGPFETAGELIAHLHRQRV